MRKTIVVLATALFFTGCTGDAESRARAAAEKVRDSIPDVRAKALAQKVTPEQVKQAQEALLKLKDYLGEPNGKLDAVTVNSVMAFQRAHDLTDDGILNDKTMRALRQAAR